MSAAAVTEGPYTVQIEPVYLCAKIYGQKRKGKAQHVATVWSGEDRDIEVVKRNAALLATSHELLAALKAMTELYVVCARLTNPAGWDAENDVQVKAARDAMAKATTTGGKS